MEYDDKNNIHKEDVKVMSLLKQKSILILMLLLLMKVKSGVMYELGLLLQEFSEIVEQRKQYFENKT